MTQSLPLPLLTPSIPLLVEPATVADVQRVITLRNAAAVRVNQLAALILPQWNALREWVDAPQGRVTAPWAWKQAWLTTVQWWTDTKANLAGHSPRDILDKIASDRTPILYIHAPNGAVIDSGGDTLDSLEMMLNRAAQRIRARALTQVPYPAYAPPIPAPLAAPAQPQVIYVQAPTASAELTTSSLPHPEVAAGGALALPASLSLSGSDSVTLPLNAKTVGLGLAGLALLIYATRSA